MEKIKFKIVSLFLAGIVMLSACNDNANQIQTHEHTFANFWVTNDEYHWHPSTCGHDVKGDEGKHTLTSVVTEPTYDSDGYTTYTCSVCLYSYTDDETPKLEHTYSSTRSHDKDSHWHTCIDAGYENLKKDEGEHIYKISVTNPTYESGGYTTYTCSICGYSYTDDETEALPITITWKNYDDSILEVDENVPYGSIPSYDGTTPIKESDGRYSYEFSGWTPELKTVTEDATYTAQFSKKEVKYTIDFDLNGGTSSSYKGSVEVLTFSKDIFFFDCAKKGWRFRGWEYNGEKIFDEKGNQLKNVTLVDHMVFKAIYSQTVKLTITTNMPEAGTIFGDGEYPYNTYVDVSVKPNKGYKFIGWYYKNTLLSNEEAYKYMMWDEDITLEARFEKDDFSLRIYSNNEDYGLVLLRDENYLDYLPEYKDLIEYKTEVTIAAYSKSDVRFLGWYDENNNLVTTNAVYTFAMPNYDYTLEAKWNYFTINYNLNGGVNNKNNVNHFNLEDNTIYLFAPTKEGYSFEGWKYNGEFVDKIDASIADNITLEAVWSSYKYEIKEDDNGKYASIIGFDETIIDAIIPETVTLNGEKIRVKEISQTAFKGNQNVKSIIVSNEVITIDENAFDGCSSLESIYLPISVTTIGSNAFNGCSLITIYSEASSKPDGWSNDFNPLYRPVVWNNYSQFYGNLDGLIYTICQDKSNDKYIEIVKYIGNKIDLVIPETINVDGEALTVKSISENAFYNNDTIIYASIPNSVLKIGNNAFRNCINLKEITISENALLTIIGSHAFDGCKLLSNINLPSTVNEIGSFAFYNCSSLLSINIPDSVITIEEYTFANCSKLANISIGKNSQLVTIGQYAFNNCSSLTSIYIPGSITTIGNNAFEDCSNLTAVTIGENSQLTTIGNFAFTRCSSLASIFIPSSVTTIGDYAFRNCSNLTIYCEVDTKLEGWSDYWNNSNCPVIWNSYKGIYGNSNGLEYIACHDTEGNPYIVIIGYNGSNTNVVIPKSINVNGEDIIVKEISNTAFRDNTNITSINIPGSVTTIGNDAFSNCSNLTIYCEAPSQPSGWSSSWNSSNRPVVWNCINYGITAEGIHYGVLIDENGNKYIAIAGYSGSNTNVVIPEYINVNGNEIIVKTITKDAFYENDIITSVTISSSVVKIGERAFSNCSSLTSIYIPSSVTTIGERAFSGCSNLTICCEVDSKLEGWSNYWNNSNCPVIWNSYKGIYGNINGLEYIAYHDAKGNPYIVITEYSGSNTKVVIPEYININGEEIIVKTIADNAFYDNNTIRSVTIPDSVTSIGFCAFYECQNLETITFGENSQLTTIGESAFYNCDSLTSIFIPSSVTTIRHYVFYSCSKLTIYCEASSKPIDWYQNWNSSNRPVIWNSYKGIHGNLNGLKYIAYHDTEGNPYIVITEYYNSSNTNVVIPEYINANGENIIVKKINKKAFYNNHEITSVFIPSSVTSIGELTFAYCSNLTIYCEASSQPDGWDYWWNYTDQPVVWSSYKGIYGNLNGFEYIAYHDTEGNPYIVINGYNGSNTNVVIPESINVNGEDIIVKVIADKTFYCNDRIISISIPSSVTTIGERVFGGCSSLTSIYIPSSVTTIGQLAFVDCSNLTTVTIGENSLLTKIGDSAFSNCSSLTAIYIPSSVITIGNNAFKNCSNLATVTIGENSQLTTIGEGAFAGCSSLTSIYIPGSVITIGNNAFEDCSNLTTVTIGDNSLLTTIGEGSFSNCSSLTSIYIPSSVTTIGNDAFSNCSNLIIYCEVFSQPSGWSSSWNSSNRPVVWSSYNEIHGNLNDFEYGVCINEDGNIYITIVGYNGSNTNVVIPEYIKANEKDIIVKTIADNAFYDNDTITSVTIPNSVTTIGSGAFYSCSNIERVTFGDNSQLTSIGDSAFSHCSSLTSTYIPNNVTTIGNQAFSNCSSLTSIYIPSSVITIGDDTFSGCSNLITVTFGGNSQLTSIEDNTFRNCSSLTSIYIPNSVTTIGSNAFSGCSNLTIVTIGENSQLATIGKEVFSYCSSLTSIYIPSSVTKVGNDAFSNCSNLIIYCEVDTKLEGWSNYWNNSNCLVIWNSYKGIYGNLNGLEYATCYDEYGNLYIVITGYNGSNTNVVIPEYINIDGKDIIVKEVSNTAFRDNINITSINIPSSVTVIGERVFYNCSSLTLIYIPSSVTSIGNDAFSNCSNLTIYCEATSQPSGWSSTWNSSNRTVVWSSYKAIHDNFNGLEYIAYHDIEGNPYIVIIGYNGSNTNVVIPKSINVNGEDIIVKEISNTAFRDNTNITSINIPGSVTTIGNDAFSNCSNLTIYCEASSRPSGWDLYWNITYRPVVWNCIDYGITAEGIHYGVLIDEDGNKYITIAGYSGSNTNVVIPEYINVNGNEIIVKTITKDAFYGNDIITSVIIPNSVTTIGYSTFAHCSNLTTVTIGENSQLATIGKEVFSYCSSLTSIYIPSSVTSIGNYAFSNCSNLTIYCEAPSQPSGWSSYWNNSDRPVVWNITYEEYLVAIA